MADQAYEPRLKAEYRARIRSTLREQFGYTNEMQIPKLDKIVLNMGIGEAVGDSKKVAAAMADLTRIVESMRQACAAAVRNRGARWCRWAQRSWQAR